MKRMHTFLIVLITVCSAQFSFAESLFQKDLDAYLQTGDTYQSEAPDLGNWSLELSISPVGADGRDESSKFTEYRDVPNGAWSDLKAEYRNQSQLFSAAAHNIGLDDQSYKVVFESFGNYRGKFLWDQIPHRYAFGARTLYTGIGSGVLELDDNIQQTLQDAPNPFVGASLLKSFFNGASSFDEETLRKKATANFDLFMLHPFQLKAEYKHENRTGTRPFSGAFSFSNFVELPLPIDYNTNEVRFSAEHATESLYWNASYYLSVFENNITSLTFDNLWRTSDITLPEIPAIFLTSIGAARGRIDLFPSNDYQNFAFTLAYRKLPWKGQLSGVFGWGFLKQNDPLLPYTTNTAIVPGGPNNPPFVASDPSNLPASVVENRMDTPHLQLNYSARPGKKVQFKAQYRYSALNNDSDSIVTPGLASLDNYWRNPLTPGAFFTNFPIAYDQNNLAFDVIWNVQERSRLSFGYTYDRMNREFREVAELSDNKYRVGFDSQLSQQIDLRVSYERSSREGNSYDFSQAYRNRGEQAVTIFPYLRKFDQANRDRDDFKVLVNYHTVGGLILSGSVLYGKDDFTKQQSGFNGQTIAGFGLLNDSHTVTTVDVSYSVPDRFDINGYYSFETYKNEQQSRSWIPLGPGDPFTLEPGPNSASNWSAHTNDDVNTFGANFHAAIVPGKWDLSFQLTYSKSDGHIDFASTVGPPLDLNPYTPGAIEELDDVERWVVIPELKYRPRENCSVSFGYWYDSYDITDFAVKGFTNIPTTAGGAYNGSMLMGTLPQDYQANVFYVTLGYKL